MAPISRHEQLELDELLSDIYRGIETLPDNSGGAGSGGAGSGSNNKFQNYTSREFDIEDSRTKRTLGRAYVREYELNESSPLVQQHKAELASTSSSSSRRLQQPQRSTLKRQTQPQQQRVGTPAATGVSSGGGGGSNSFPSAGPPQSLASFVTNNPVASGTSSGARATPEHKRRVRIVDHRKPEVGYSEERVDEDDDDYNENENVDDDEIDYYPAASSEYLGTQFDSRQRVGGSEIERGTGNSKKQKVKYVNTNKLIYHQERNPEDFEEEDEIAYRGSRNSRNIENEADYDDYDDDDYDLDGKTKVEYYHTTWLDRQLGRASKRRSSKELNERQVKEKAMIEELKRSLKNGAITLRRSFKGKKGSGGSNKKSSSDDLFNDNSLDYNNNNNQQQSHQRVTTKDDYFARKSNNNNNNNNKIKSEKQLNNNKSSIFSSGLATIPRNYNHQTGKLSNNKNNNKQFEQREVANVYYRDRPAQQLPPPPSPQVSGPHISRQLQSPIEPAKVKQQTTLMQQQYSRTLPSKRSQHQLLQSHYRGSARAAQPVQQPHQQQNIVVNKSATLAAPPYNYQHQQQQQQQPISNNMRNPQYSNQQTSSNWCASNDTNTNVNQQQQQQQLRVSGAKSPMQQQASSELNRMPSATEVVRSALSRSSSQVSLNQLNKTINLLPNSPPPYAPSTTPTTQQQNLRAATPSPLSPSPLDWQLNNVANCRQQDYSSKTLGHQQQQQQPQSQQPPPTIQQTNTSTGSVVLHGTRTVGRPPQLVNQQQPPITQNLKPKHQLQQELPVYANPHASLMQHRQEQQSRQPNRNSASIREFNELDSLLRSLSPGASSGAYRAQPSQPNAVTQTAYRTPAQISTGGGIGATTTQITPAYTNKPMQPTFGGYMSAANNQPLQQQQQQQSSIRPVGDLYAKVQKLPTATSNLQQQQQQPIRQQFTHQQHQPYTIDVTNDKTLEQLDENCLANSKLQHPHHKAAAAAASLLSDFEPPAELLPSMEDYQNISKLNPVTNRFWYKPKMSREHAISLLKDKPQGTFIVRDSTSFEGAYGLAVKVSKLPRNVLENINLRSYNDPSAEYIRHFLIEPAGSGVRLKGYANEPLFDNLADLIYQHSLTELALPCKLLIPRADIEDPKFNYKQKQFYDEFLASKEQAKHQPYERTSPNGGYRRYPGDVLVHNEHRIIFE